MQANNAVPPVYTVYITVCRLGIHKQAYELVRLYIFFLGGENEVMESTVKVDQPMC